MTFKDELKAILEELLSIVEKLKEFSFEKTDYIIASQIEKIDKITKEEEVLINRMGTLENKRMETLETWGVAIDTPISDIIEKLPEGDNGLGQLKDDLTMVFEELLLRNEINNNLIMENLDWIDFNINLITDVPAESNYGDEKRDSKGKSIFDRKV